jgi:hypothetical protein
MNIQRNEWAIHFLPGIMTIAMALFASTACAQQQPGSATEPQTTTAQGSAQKQSGTADQDKTGSNTNTPADTKSGTSNDRLFYTLPNFLTLENSGQVPPLTTKQKFGVVARGSFDYVEIPWYGFLAGISQAENSEPGYGQGAAGYGKRYGAAAADGTIENFMTGAILPSLLKEDPRFYQSSSGGFLHRTGYAVSRIFVTRTDRGTEEFNYSEIFGSAISAGISTYSYHPHADKSLANTASVWGTQVGYDTITIVVKEFWPDIRRMISHKRQGETATP